MTLAKLVSTESLNPRTSRFERRSPLPLRRDALWQIEAGAVRTLTWLEDGTLVTLGLWGTGDVVSRLLSEANPYQIECLTSVEATLLPLTAYPQVNEALIQHVQQLQKFLEILHSRPVDVALVRLLTWLAKKFGREVDKGKLIELRLTHQEIGEILGTTRVTVTRMLNIFEQQGMIEKLPRQSILLLEESATWYYEI